MLKAVFTTGRGVWKGIQHKHTASKCFFDVVRYNHEGLPTVTDAGNLANNATESSSNTGEKPIFNNTAIFDMLLEKFDDDLLYFPEILEADKWINLVDWGEEVEEAMGKLKYDEILTSGKISDNIRNKLKSLKLFGKKIPKKYGGSELNETSNTYIQEILGLCPSIARMLAENEQMGVRTLVKYGTEDQKQKYLPKLATGDSMISFAFLEESSSTLDIKNYMGLELIKAGDEFILTGKKKWVYNAKNADVFLVLATDAVNDGEGVMLLNTLFLVDKNTEGLRIHSPLEKKWFRGVDVCEVVFDEVTVKQEQLLGGYGKGFDVLKDILMQNRTAVIPECSAAVKRLFHDAVNKSKNISFLSRPLSDHQYCEHALGQMATLYYATESLTYYLAARADYYENPDLSWEVYMAKIFATEAVSEALELYFNLLGKNGYTKGSFVEELVQNAHYYSVFDDTGFDMRLYIVTYGMQYVATQSAAETKKFLSPKDHPLTFMKKLTSTADHYYDHAHPKLDLSMCVHRTLKYCTDDLEYCLNRLRHCSEMALQKYGSHLMKHDYELLVISDILINIYALIACIARSNRARFVELKGASLETHLTRAFSLRTAAKIKTLSATLGKHHEQLESYAEAGRKALTTKEYLAEHPLMRNF